MFEELNITTIKEFQEFKFKEKGSLFIGQALPVETKDDAEKFLEEIRKKYYDATHHCYCYKLNKGENKYSDDGEPNGTAGIRILNSIEHFNFTDLLVVVIRYYGGTKLGVGPLGKAYYHGAFGVLEECIPVHKSAYLKLKIKYDFDNTSQVHHLLNKYEAEIIANLYEDKPAIEFYLKPGKYEDAAKEFIELTRGQSELILIEQDIIK